MVFKWSVNEVLRIKAKKPEELRSGMMEELDNA